MVAMLTLSERCFPTENTGADLCMTIHKKCNAFSPLEDDNPGTVVSSFRAQILYFLLRRFIFSVKADVKVPQLEL